METGPRRRRGDAWIDRRPRADRIRRSQAATPKLSIVQHGGAAIILLGYYETDLLMLRLLTVSGLLCYSVVPNAARGNARRRAVAKRGRGDDADRPRARAVCGDAAATARIVKSQLG